MWCVFLLLAVRVFDQVVPSKLCPLLEPIPINVPLGPLLLAPLRAHASVPIFCVCFSSLTLGTYHTHSFVVFDTQLMVEKASLGDRDFAWHAAELFIDFVGIFVRICIILMRNREKRDSRKRESRGGTARR